MARAYTLKGEEIAKQKFMGQSALIISAMSEIEARTTSQITLAIKDRLVTRQDPERVVAFYMGVWKKSGLITLHEVAGETTPAPAAPAEPTTVTEVPAPADYPSPSPEPGGVTEPTTIEVPQSEPVPVSEVGETAPLVAEEEARYLPDLAGMKLSTAVEEVLKFKQTSLNTEDVTKVLNDHGYEFKENQVASALTALLKRESVTKIEGGFYQLAS